MGKAQVEFQHKYDLKIYNYL